MPFGVDANNMDELTRDIAELPLAFTYEDYCRLDVATLDFLESLLMKNPEDRLTLEEIKAHDYFKGM
jgi:serine/threonine protein kinase